MIHPNHRTKEHPKPLDKTKKDPAVIHAMEKGYKEMADINLSISKLCFEVESEAQTYYDCVAESE